MLSRSSVSGLINDLIPFGLFLGEHHSEVSRLSQLERHHVEEFLVWNRTRGSAGPPRQRSASVGVGRARHGAHLRNFLDDMTLWGWADRPARRLVFASDVPRIPRPLPLGLAPDIDTALMVAVDRI